MAILGSIKFSVQLAINNYPLIPVDCCLESWRIHYFITHYWKHWCLRTPSNDPRCCSPCVTERLERLTDSTVIQRQDYQTHTAVDICHLYKQ